MSKLTFEEFRAANRVRCLKWHPQGIESWSDSDWITAIVGELGELASLIKMRNRERDGMQGNKFSPSKEDIEKEAADVFTYLDLFCERNGIDLGEAAARKFNEVSERVGFPDRIQIHPAATEKHSRCLVRGHLMTGFKSMGLCAHASAGGESCGYSGDCVNKSDES